MNVQDIESTILRATGSIHPLDVNFINEEDSLQHVRDVSNRFGCRQSIPSISIASCAGIRNTLPSRVDGRASGHAPAFGQQAQSVAGGPQQFDLTAAAAPEDEDVAGHRVIFQRCLHLCGETIEAVAHIGDTGNQPDFVPAGRFIIQTPHQFAQDSAHKLN